MLWLSLSVGGAQARSHPVCSQPTQATRDWVPRTRERRQARRPEQPPIGTDIAATQTAGVLATPCHTVLSTLRPARACAYLG